MQLFNNKRRKYIGVDLFDIPLKATEIKDGVFVNTSISEVKEILAKSKKFKGKNITQKIDIDTKYWYDFEIVSELLRYVVHQSKSLFLKPAVCISIPHIVVESDNGDMFTRMVEEAAFSAGFCDVSLIEGFICAALGMGFMNYTTEIDEKNIFIFSTDNCTYIGIIFGGSHFNVGTINKSYKDLMVADIKDKFNEVINSLSKDMPKDFENMALGSSAIETLKKGWAQEIQKNIYLSVDLKKKDIFLDALQDDEEGYKLIFDENHELAIMNGMTRAIEFLKE